MRGVPRARRPSLLATVGSIWLVAAMLVPGHVRASAPVLPRQDQLPVTGAQVSAYYPLAAAGIPLEGPLPIDLNLPGAHSARAADFDGDGRADVVAAARNDGRIIWYHNDGGAVPAFSPRALGKVPGAYLALPADLNRDGHIDILVVAVAEVNPSEATAGDSQAAAVAGSGQVVWFQNDGQPVPGFVQRTLATGLNYPVAAVVADLDRDGDPDVAVVSRDDSTLRWFANDGAALPVFAPAR